MSYILDALKKSDRERQQEPALHLQPLCETSPSFKAGSGPRRRRWAFLFIFGLLCMGMLLKWSDWSPWTGKNGQGPEANTPRLEPAESGGLPAVAETDKSLHPLKVQAERFDDWAQHLPKNDSPLPPEKNVSPDEAEPEGLPPVVKLAAIPGKKSTGLVRIKREREKVFMAPQEGSTVISQSPPAAVVQAEPLVAVTSPTVSGSAGPASTPMAEPRPSQPARQPQPVASAFGQPEPAPSKKPGSNLPYLQDLPYQVRTEIPKLQFAGHAYAVDPAQRLIVVNGTIMREGDHIDAVTRLAEITWEGVVIDRKGVRFQVKCY